MHQDDQDKDLSEHRQGLKGLARCRHVGENPGNVNWQ